MPCPQQVEDSLVICSRLSERRIGKRHQAVARRRCEALYSMEECSGPKYSADEVVGQQSKYKSVQVKYREFHTWYNCCRALPKLSFLTHFRGKVDAVTHCQAIF